MAPLTPALWLCLRRLILNWIFLVLAVILLGCIHHIYVVRRSGRPASGKRRVLALLLIGIVVHTVDVFGAVIEHVGQVLDSGYVVGGGWEAKFPVISLQFEPDIVRL